jgi:glycosyltransferase involved in cell wall biosynthesis
VAGGLPRSLNRQRIVKRAHLPANSPDIFNFFLQLFNFSKVISSKIRLTFKAVKSLIAKPGLRVPNRHHISGIFEEVDVEPGKAPLRLMHLITSLNIGGAQMHLYKTVTRFEPAKIASMVVSLVPPGKIGKLLEEKGIPVLNLGMQKGRPNLKALRRLRGLIKRFRPHILQTYLYHADLLGYLAGRWAGVPVILWNIQQSRMDFSQYRPTTDFTVRLCARLSRRVKKILVNSYAGLKAHVLQGYDEARMVFMPNGYELNNFQPRRSSYLEVRQELGLTHDTPLVGMLARFDPQKDHAMFLQAARQVVARHPEVCILMGGNGVIADNPAFEALLRESPLPPERLRLLGERTDMPRQLAALDIFVSSSAFGEGSPNVIGEAMACGVPCVVTDVGDSAFIVGETGLVVQPRQPQDLSRAIAEVLSWPDAERASRGQAARARIQQKFDINRIVEELESFYLDLAA